MFRSRLHCRIKDEIRQDRTLSILAGIFSRYSSKRFIKTTSEAAEAAPGCYSHTHLLKSRVKILTSIFNKMLTIKKVEKAFRAIRLSKTSPYFIIIFSHFLSLCYMHIYLYIYKHLNGMNQEYLSQSHNGEIAQVGTLRWCLHMQHMQYMHTFCVTGCTCVHAYTTTNCCMCCAFIRRPPHALSAHM